MTGSMGKGCVWGVGEDKGDCLPNDSVVDNEYSFGNYKLGFFKG